jgi:hypothetical protein
MTDEPMDACAHAVPTAPPNIATAAANPIAPALSNHTIFTPLHFFFFNGLFAH